MPLDIKVYIAFGSTIYDSSPSWDDVSNDLMSLSIQRGRQYEMNRLEAGTAVIQLRNLAGNYWPNNSTGAFYPNVMPVKAIKIQTIYGGITYDIFSGFIESWQPEFILKPITAPVMTLTCADMTKSLSYFMLNNAGYGLELSGTRINNVLNSFGWPSTSRIIDAGQSNMISTGALVNQNSLDHIYQIQDSEDGLFFMSDSGGAIFQDRHYRTSTTTSLALFGDTPTTSQYSEIELIRDDLLLFNQARIQRTGGTEQVYGTATSAEALRDGLRVYASTGLLLNNDTECYIKAEYKVFHYNNSQLRARSILLKGESNPADLYPKIFGYEISDKITVKLSQASLNTDYFIDGIRHDWDAQSKIWQTRWQLTNALWNVPTLDPVDISAHPSANGTTIELIPTDVPNWQRVQGTYGGGYVYPPSPAKKDTYQHALTMPANPTINSVKLTAVISRGGAGSATLYSRLILYIGGNFYYSGYIAYPAAAVYTWTVNPVNGHPWTYSDIQNLEIGVELDYNNIVFIGYLVCFELLLTVNVNPIW